MGAFVFVFEPGLPGRFGGFRTTGRVGAADAGRFSAASRSGGGRVLSLRLTFAADCRHVTRLLINEAGGDYTVINFQAVEINRPEP
ncbi:MAG TPA: hypothetical protein ENN66_07595 [Proteobacteria bacterium]|nr:hypothetical protein [Pseudomonadota bacterium]